VLLIFPLSGEQNQNLTALPQGGFGGLELFTFCVLFSKNSFCFVVSVAYCKRFFPYCRRNFAYCKRFFPYCTANFAYLTAIFAYLTANFAYLTANFVYLTANFAYLTTIFTFQMR
jgi:hypothetical protein